MCQARVYFKEKDKEVLLKDVILIKCQGDKVIISSMEGEEKVISGIIKEVDFMNHEVILEKK